MFNSKTDRLSDLFEDMAGISASCKPFVENSAGERSPCVPLVSYAVAETFTFAALCARNVGVTTDQDLAHRISAVNHIVAKSIQAYADHLEEDSALSPEDFAVRLTTKKDI